MSTDRVSLKKKFQLFGINIELVIKYAYAFKWSEHKTNALDVRGQTAREVSGYPDPTHVVERLNRLLVAGLALPLMQVSL